jgi:hypothetical protein
MGGKPVGIALLLLSCVGCHACQNNCDYLSPVANSLYTVPGQRAGSAFGGSAVNGPLPDPALSESELLDKQDSQEYSQQDSQGGEINQTLRELLAIDE